MWGVEILPPQIFEARLAIEPELARLAAQKRYPEDVAHLRRAFNELDAQFVDTGTYEHDFAIHRAIGRAARNPILERALEDALVHTQSGLWVDFTDRVFATGHARASQHEQVRRAIQHIENGNGVKAATVWRQHLILLRDEMLGRTSSRPLSSTALITE
jgi:DNA-binding FadR family transcriptional regulator